MGCDYLNKKWEEFTNMYLFLRIDVINRFKIYCQKRKKKNKIYESIAEGRDYEKNIDKLNKIQNDKQKIQDVYNKLDLKKIVARLFFCTQN